MRWIGGPSLDDVKFYGSGTRLTLDGTILDAPFVYHLDGKLATAFDASLIESGLPVARSHSTHVSRLPYWPNYRGCTPYQRRKYLHWLKSGRTDTAIEVGYVFLYFYGLERRIVVDRADHEPIALEVLRLVSLYGDSNSFRRYAASLLWLIVLTAPNGELSNDLLMQIVSRLNYWTEGHLGALLAVYFRRQSPLPPDVAFVLAEHAPGSPRGVVVRRHRDKLYALFQQRYQSQFGVGLPLQASKREARFEYRPASESLLSLWYDHPFKNISMPNVFGLASQFQPLLELWTSCVEELRQFDRAHRKSDGETMTAEMYEALPDELRRDEHPDFDRWYSVLGRHTNDDAWVLVPVAELAVLRGISKRARLTRKQCDDLLRTADAMHLCVEPDARETGQCYHWGDRVSVFPGERNSFTNQNSYHAASLLLRLGLTVAAADGTVNSNEMTTITKHLQEQFDLSDQDSTRLEHLAYVLAHSETANKSVGKSLSYLPLQQRQVIGELLVAVAAADDIVTPEETRALRQAYRSIGLDVASLDALAAGYVRSVDAPIDQEPELVLDYARIRQKMAETAKVAEFLQSVMIDDDDDSLEEPIAQNVEVRSIRPSPGTISTTLSEPFHELPHVRSRKESDEPFSGLDARYHAFLDCLLTKPEWTRTALDMVAREHGVMLSGAFDAINEWTLESLGDWLVEDIGAVVFIRPDLLPPVRERAGQKN